MKLAIKLFTLIGIISVLGLVNCKKESTTPTETRTKKELLKSSAWVLSASVSKTPVDLDGMNGASTDLFSQMKLCEKDNSFLFKADSTVTEINNTKCFSNEASTYKGTWIMSPDEKTVNWNGSVYPIAELTGTKFVITYSIKKGTETYELTDTYSH